MLIAVANGFYDPGDGTIGYVVVGQVNAPGDQPVLQCPSCFIS